MFVYWRNKAIVRIQSKSTPWRSTIQFHVLDRSMNSLKHYQGGIYSIDSNYVRPRLAAVHLIVENNRMAFVDTGSNDSLPAALEALAELDIPATNVDYVILTHIHLDHAGGAGVMMQAFPNARLVVHPRGARHMAAPTKLIEGAVAVYGADEVRRL